jgi:hypothetical protein
VGSADHSSLVANGLEHLAHHVFVTETAVFFVVTAVLLAKNVLIFVIFIASAVLKLSIPDFLDLFDLFLTEPEPNSSLLVLGNRFIIIFIVLLAALVIKSCLSQVS